MVALVEPDEEERYLLAILDSPDGIDLAEFAVHDPRNDDGCYRLYDYQHNWFQCRDTYQIDQGGRNLGKTESVKLRALAFPFYHAGKGMLVTAPELNHLRPLTDEIEKMLLGTRIVREMLPPGKGAGIARQPHWQVRFRNASSIVSRLPNKDGRGVKAQHVVQLEIDEASDYPAAGWREVVETLNAGDPDAMWRCHGVSRGVRDSFFEKTQPGSGWTVHRPMAMNRPSWSAEERNNKIVEYGGSRQSVDYKRNIYGEHGDASASVFVLAKLMHNVDLDEGSTYNSDVYTCIKLELERFPNGADTSDDERIALIYSWIDIPGEHFHGYSQRVGNAQVGAPNGYSAYWGGMDVGVTNHPSEILIFGQRTGTDFLELLTRVQMQRINVDDQMLVVERLFALYGDRLRFGVDRTGVGFPLWDQLTRRSFGTRVYGFGFSEKRIAGFEDRDLLPGETQKDLARFRNMVEASTDWLRNDYIDVKRFRLPYDREVLIEFQGQSYCCDDQTEILTRRGWLRYDEVEVGDETLGMVDSGGALISQWTPVRAINVFTGMSRQLVSLEGQAHSSLTTLDHRWLGKPYYHAKYAEWRRSIDLLAEDVNYRVPLTATRSDFPDTAKYDDDFVELVAWYYTEGHAIVGGKIGFAQSPTANPHNVAAIEGMLTRLLGPGNIDIGKRRRDMRPWSRTSAKSSSQCHGYRILDRELCSQVLQVVRGRDKIVIPEFLAALTRSQLDLFIEVSIAADGCAFERVRSGRNPTLVFTFMQENEDRMKSFEMACALAGVPTMTKYYAPANQWRCTLLHRRHAHVRSMQRRIIDSDGPVWCPTTDTGTWLARRNGAVFFTGNSVVRDNGDPYGVRRAYSGGSFHTLDAAKVMIATKHIPPLEAMLEDKPKQAPVLDVFMGA